MERARMQVDGVPDDRGSSGELKRLFAAVRAASSWGPAKARLFLEDMI